VSVATLKGRPTARAAQYQGQPVAEYRWTNMRLERAPDVAGHPGTFAPLETRALDPLDADPTHPQLRTFTTELAGPQPEWLRLAFIDATGDEEITDPVFNRAPEEQLVSPEDVRDHLPTRRVDDAVILAFIDRATEEMVARFGPITASTRGLFRAAIEIRAALRTERRVVPEQIGEEGMSPYLSLERELNDLLRALDGLTAGDSGTGTSGGTGGTADGPRYSFGTVPVTSSVIAAGPPDIPSLDELDSLDVWTR
jgi:hypothetical protein